MEKYLEAGKIVNTHGVNGCIKLEPWFDTVKTAVEIKTFYMKKNGEYLPLEVETASVQKSFALIKFKGCDSFESAILYKNKIIYADRADIPLKEGDYFICDLIGLSVTDADNGKVYGKLNDVLKGGSGQIYEIKRDSGKLDYIPAVSEFVVEIDTVKGIFIRPIEGMFDEI